MGSGPSAPILYPKKALSKRQCTPSTLHNAADEKSLFKRAYVPSLGSAQHPALMSMTCSKGEQQSTLPQPLVLREIQTWKYEVRGKEEVRSGL